MITIVAALLLAAAPAAPAKMSTKWVAVKAKIQQTVQTSWAVRHHEGKDVIVGSEGDARLGPRLSPPVPATWPPTGKGGYYVYAFAAGARPSVHDGEEVAAPWARAVIDGTNQRVEDLGQLKRLGMQGVRPLSGSTVEILKTAEAAEQEVVALTRTAAPKSGPPKPAPVVQRYYCQWSFDNAVIAAELQRLHPDFWKWLGCP
jgi:hypothetical protein